MFTHSKAPAMRLIFHDDHHSERRTTSFLVVGPTESRLLLRPEDPDYPLLAEAVDIGFVRDSHRAWCVDRLHVTGTAGAQPIPVRADLIDAPTTREGFTTAIGEPLCSAVLRWWPADDPAP